MNQTSICNCCAKESVCKYTEFYKCDCRELDERSMYSDTTEIRITCKEFAPIVTAIKEVQK